MTLLLALAAGACSVEPDACVSTYPGTDTPFEACRQDLDARGCAAETTTSALTPGRRCATLGFVCLSDAWGGVLWRRRTARGCPAGTSEVR